MTIGALRVSAIALGAAALVLPLSADAATVSHHYRQAAHSSVAHHSVVRHSYVARGHAQHSYVARGYAGHRRYVWRNGHRYAYYGYNPGAAGVVAGAAAGYPYCGDDYGSYYGSCDDYSYGYPYPDYGYDYGFGGPVFFERGHFHHRFDHGFGFHGGGARVAGGNLGHTGSFDGGHVGGFGGGHFGGFGGGHFGGFGGGHFSGFGGGHFR
jgi:hypothetical protein